MSGELGGGAVPLVEDIVEDFPLVHERFTDLAYRQPHAPAVITPRETLTYRQLQRRAHTLATHVHHTGVGPETPVGLYLPAGPTLIVAILAVFHAGGCAVVLDPQQPRHRIEHLLDTTGISTLVATTAQPPPPWLHPTHTILEDTLTPVPGGDITPATVHPDSAAYIVQTSGSTGQPKHLVVTHRVLAHGIATYRAIFGMDAGTRGSMLAAHGTLVSLGIEMWPPLNSGGAVTIPDPWVQAVPEDLRDWLLDSGTTHAYLVAPVAERLARAEWPTSERLGTIVVGSDRLQHWPAPDFPYELGTCSGATEADMITCSFWPPAERLTSRTVSARPGEVPRMGRAWPGVRIHLLDEDMQPVAPSEVGELYVASAEVARGYLDAGLTASRFLPDPYGPPGTRLYRTGDLVRAHPDHTLEHCGRTDHQVRIRGNRVELGEIEAALLRQAGITQAVIIAATDPHGDTCLAAYAVPDPTVTPPVTTAALRRALATELPLSLRPSYLALLDHLPLGPNNKVDRRQLPPPAWDDEEPEQPTTSSAPPPQQLSEESARLATIIGTVWAEVLETQVTAQDDFFLLGGDSLSAARAARALQRATGLPVTARDVLLHPHVEQLAVQLSGLGRSAD